MNSSSYVKKEHSILGDDVIQYNNLLLKRSLDKQITSNNKQKLNELTRKASIDLLALEWLNNMDASIEMRAYLVENFLPILVLGCEKVLKEAESRNLIDQNSHDVNFNPINQLAQYLMRNNPKYNNQNEMSSYTRTMRQVYMELREKMFAFQGNRLAKIKADERKRHIEREHIEKLKQIEIHRRKNELTIFFQKWLEIPKGWFENKIVGNFFII
jgi:hypothetical protein